MAKKDEGAGTQVKYPVSIEGLTMLRDAVNTLATQIQGATGKDTQQRNSIKETIKQETQEQADTLFQRIHEFLASPEVTEHGDKVFAGLVFNIQNALEVDWNKRVDSLVDNQIAEATKGVKDNVEALRESHKSLKTKFQNMKAVLADPDMFGLQDEVSKVEDPISLRGGGGGGGRKAGSGTKAEGKFNFYMTRRNGELGIMSDSQNTFSTLAYFATVQDGKRMKAEELQAYLRKGGIDHPKDHAWEAPLPNGKTVKAVRVGHENDEVKVWTEGAEVSPPEEAPAESAA